MQQDFSRARVSRANAAITNSEEDAGKKREGRGTETTKIARDSNKLQEPARDRTKQRKIGRRLGEQIGGNTKYRMPYTHATDRDEEDRALGLALVQLAHRVFDMLAQQPALFGCHMPVAAALVEVRGNGGTQHYVGSGTVDARTMAHCAAVAVPGRALARRSFRGRLRMGERRAQ